jgi:hypothetical protein
MTIRNDRYNAFRPQERTTAPAVERQNNHNSRSVTPNGATPTNQPLLAGG